MEIYQGEPLGGKIHIKEDGAFLPSLEGVTIKALLAAPNGAVVRRWSTEDGTITIGTEELEGQTVGYGAFSMPGADTANLRAGRYRMEIARYFENEPAIGVANDVVLVRESIIGRDND